MKKLIALLMALCLLLSAGAALADVTYPIKTCLLYTSDAADD